MRKLYSVTAFHNEQDWARSLFSCYKYFPSYFIHQAFQHCLSSTQIENYLTSQHCNKKKLIAYADQHTELLKTNLTADLAQHMLTEPNKYPASWIAVARNMVDQDGEKKRERENSNKPQDEVQKSNEEKTEGSNKKQRLEEDTI
jgi:hypothetical protein